MSMVEQLFSVEYADRGDLFEGLSIWEEEKYRSLQGTVFCKTFLDKVAKHFWTLLHVHFGHNCKALASVVCASQYSFADII